MFWFSRYTSSDRNAGTIKITTFRHYILFSSTGQLPVQWWSDYSQPGVSTSGGWWEDPQILRVSCEISQLSGWISSHRPSWQCSYQDRVAQEQVALLHIKTALGFHGWDHQWTWATSGQFSEAGLTKWKCLRIVFWLTRRSRFCGNNNYVFGHPIATATSYCLLPDRFRLRASKNAFKAGSVKFTNSLSSPSIVKKVCIGSKSSQGT